MKKVAWFSLYILFLGCVDPISITAPDLRPQLVVDGMITDEPGPYTITLSYTRKLDADSSNILPLVGAKVTIQSDANETENLIETAQPGVYQTVNIQGVVGRSYSISIRTGAKVYESTPELLSAAGQIDAVNYAFERVDITVGGVKSHVGRFKITADGKAPPSVSGENYLRWRVVGTYKVENFPQFRITTDPVGVKIPNPPPCSGYVGSIRYGPCTCCTCWVSDYGVPQVTDTRFADAGVFKDVAVGQVAVNRRTFYDKYYVSVEQLTLTAGAYNFWRMVQSQREGASSLFQPPLAQIKSNVISLTDKTETVQGYFSAAGVALKSFFLSISDVPINLPPIDTLTISCLGANSTGTQPPFWK